MDEFDLSGYGFGEGLKITKDNYYKHFLGNLDLEFCNDLFGYEGGRKYCNDHYYGCFIQFQKWCRIIYDDRKDDQDKAYFFFRDILVEFQLSKKDSFYENDDKIFHVLTAEPISDEGNPGQQMAYIIFRYFNLAITCLEDYVKQLSPTKFPSAKENTTLPPKIRGFKIKNKDCLNSAFDKLRSRLIITLDVRYKDFEDAFTGFIPENKITWSAGPGLLSYFIKRINGKGIEFKKDKWITTVKCFQNKTQNDKIPKDFTISQLQHIANPIKTKEVDQAITIINRYSEEED